MAETVTSFKSEAGPLIAGAGPTGLALALRLARHGIPFRIIDRSPGPGSASRAIVMHARSLELYRQIGLADDMVALGMPMESATLRATSGRDAQISFKDLGAGLSPYPFVLSLAQDEHERFLVRALERQGIGIEWETELVSFGEEGDRLRVVLQRRGVREETTAAFLCGCDGAHSTVRQQLGIDFPGGTYDERFFVADVHSPRRLRDHFVVAFGGRTFVLMFPVRRTGMQRLIGLVPRDLNDRAGLSFDDVRPFAEDLLDIRVDSVNWFSTYSVHHRVAAHFRTGRVFIAGDAAHIHSPAGGQGMNTGIGDAVNLSWKIAHVLQEKIDPSVLDTYETERIAFAKTLVRTTDRAFQLIVGDSWRARFVRTVGIPHILPLLTTFAPTRRGIFRRVSQIQISYRHSPLSKGNVGNVHGGDRLPWVAAADNFASLESLDWQIHVYGTTVLALERMAATLGLPLHTFAWSTDAKAAGLARDAMYLIRPDGHIALASEQQDAALLEEYVARWSLTSSPLPGRQR